MVTFRRTQSRSLVSFITGSLAVAMLFFTVAAQLLVWSIDAETTDVVHPEAGSQSTNYADKLIAEHKGFDECWTGGEGHPIPTGVVIVMDGDDSAKIRTGRIVSVALDGVLSGEIPSRIRSIHGFCA